jgi:periplasmic divalent cation tolerance protein
MNPETTMAQPILILTNLPDEQAADKLARQIVEKRLAACVNRLPGVLSVYRWNGAVEQASEATLLIKTTQDRYQEVETAIKALHPYELPEIIALSIADGLPAYLDWIVQETKKEVHV